VRPRLGELLAPLRGWCVLLPTIVLNRVTLMSILLLP